MTKETIELLRNLADKYETAGFLADDPSQFMHHYSDPRDQETMAFIASSLSFGRRSQFLGKVRLIEAETCGQPYLWIKERGYEQSKLLQSAAPTDSFYRMVTYADMLSLLRAMAQTPLFDLMRTGQAECSAATIQKAWTTPHLVPRDTKSTCKRLHMFMRWMVRSGSPVDIGIWAGRIDRRSLIIPLDTHVFQQSRLLGLTEGRSMSLRTALDITHHALEVFPDDPLRLDFALFGRGVEKNISTQ